MLLGLGLAAAETRFDRVELPLRGNLEIFSGASDGNIQRQRLLPKPPPPTSTGLRHSLIRKTRPTVLQHPPPWPPLQQTARNRPQHQRAATTPSKSARFAPPTLVNTVQPRTLTSRGSAYEQMATPSQTATASWDKHKHGKHAVLWST